MIQKLLNREFTLLNSKSDRFLMIGICLVFSILFVNLFVPFNINRWFSDSGIIQTLRLSSYGLVVAIVLLFSQFPLRQIFKIRTFKIHSYIQWVTIEILLISLVYILLYGNIIGNFINDFIFSIKYTLLGICLPYIFSLLIIYYKNQRQEILKLQKKVSNISIPQMILFKDENDKDKFSLLSTNIHFIETEDNYVMVHYNEGEQLKKKMLRNTLKNIEIQLKDFPIKRCHRSFMVNIQNLESAVNNRKRLQLKLKSHDRLIPVSKNYSSIFWNLLSQA